MAAEPPDEAVKRLGQLCRVLAEHRVDFVVFGSMAGVLQGVPLRTEDADLVPRATDDNLRRLCDALNTLEPRWRVEGFPSGLKVDGGRLEPRHFSAGSVAVGLVTSLGPIDVLLAPAGFEAGYEALEGTAVAMVLDATNVRVGALDDLIASKRLLQRAKDIEHLRLLETRRDETDS